MVECDICLEEYQQGDLEVHRQVCVLRLMFRCSLCTEDYVSKEGLWNHLDLHEIVDESKELHYQEIKAKHKLHQCSLCNDQRAYSESSYWKHAHDVHDGFFLRCSDCGKNFRSEELKDKHASGECKAGDHREEKQEVENMTSDAVQMKLSRGDQSSKANENRDIRLNANDVDNNITDKESELPSNNSSKRKDLPSRFACVICGTIFATKSCLRRHKRSTYSCIKGKQENCLHCEKIFQITEYQAHFVTYEKKNDSCEIFVPSSDPSRSSNAAEDTGISTSQKGIVDKSVQLLVENPSSRSSDISPGPKCVHCGKDYTSASNLRDHILSCHQLTKCSICGITFEGTSRAKYHKTMEHSKPKYECVKCSKKFCLLQRYKRHQKLCDGDISSSVEPINKDWEDTEVASNNPSCEPSGTKCPHCGVEESSDATLTRHILMHHDPVACDFCGNTFSSLSQAQRHMKMKHNESQLKCPHCLRLCYTKTRLEKHVSKCTTENIPCEYCGKLFRNEITINKHRMNCRAYQRSKEQEQKNAKIGLIDETDSSSVMEIEPEPLAETKCYYCGEEFSSPGYFNQHLKYSHELSKCDICGITVLGISYRKNHKIKCHPVPRYECTTCGEKFHHKMKYKVHRFACEHNMYSCKLCGRTFELFTSLRRHNLRFHPDKSSLDNINIVQQNDPEMEITVKDTTVSASDDQGQVTTDPFTKVDDSCPRSNERLLSNLPDDESMDSQVIDKESQLEGDRERQIILEKSLQLSPKKQSNRRFSCNICGITLHSYAQVNLHKQTKHKEVRFQCPYCTKKFYYKSRFELHKSDCGTFKHACELCGEKYKLQGSVKRHMNRAHLGNVSLGNAKITGADCTEEKKQNSFAGADAPQKLRYPKYTKGYTESRFDTEGISLLQGVNEAQTESTAALHGGSIELKLELEVEETMLQEQEYQDQNEDLGRSSGTTWDPHDSKSKDVESENAENLVNGIKVKQEYLEDEETINFGQRIS